MPEQYTWLIACFFGIVCVYYCAYRRGTRTGKQIAATALTNYQLAKNAFERERKFSSSEQAFLFESTRIRQEEIIESKKKEADSIISAARAEAAEIIKGACDINEKQRGINTATASPGEGQARTCECDTENLSPEVRQIQCALQVDSNQIGVNLNADDMSLQYRRYIGYYYEMDEWNVTRSWTEKDLSAFDGFLICEKKKRVEIVWPQYNLNNIAAHEDRLCQLYGVCAYYKFTKQKGIPIYPVYFSPAILSSQTKAIADDLRIQIRWKHMPMQYPMIKCNISKSTGERIYHLPSDMQYDKTKIELKDGEYYANSEYEAEKKGFRRAIAPRQDCAQGTQSTATPMTLMQEAGGAQCFEDAS